MENWDYPRAEPEAGKAYQDYGPAVVQQEVFFKHYIPILKQVCPHKRSLGLKIFMLEQLHFNIYKLIIVPEYKLQKIQWLAKKIDFLKKQQ